MGQRARIIVLALIAAVAVAGLISPSAPADVGAQPGSNSKDRLSKHDRALLAAANAEGKTTITILIAADKGQNRQVERGIASLGGTVRYREDSVNYIRAIIPVGQAEAAAKLAGVRALDIDELIPLD